MIRICKAFSLLTLLLFASANTIFAQPIATLLTAEDGEMKTMAVLNDHQKIGEWRTSLSNQYEGMGDFDGDGLTDILITSDWGIGILTFEDGKWKNIAAQRNGFGIGEYEFNSGTDSIRGIGDITGDGKDEIIAFNEWGMGVLSWQMGRIKVIYAAPDGTDFNGWKLRVDKDVIWGAGDTDGDGKEDLIMHSYWGIGILRYKDGKLDALALASNGKTFDNNITFATYKFKPMGVGDFDGDGLTEFVAASDDAILTLRFHNYWIEATSALRKGDEITNFRALDPAEDKVALVANLDGSTRDNIVLKSISDMAYLKRAATGFTAYAKAKAGTRVGASRLAMEDRVAGAGDFDGDRIMDVVMAGDMGIKILSERKGALSSVASTSSSGKIGSWPIGNSDYVVGVGEFSAPGTFAIFIRK